MSCALASVTSPLATAGCPTFTVVTLSGRLRRCRAFAGDTTETLRSSPACLVHCADTSGCAFCMCAEAHTILEARPGRLREDCLQSPFRHLPGDRIPHLEPH